MASALTILQPVPRPWKQILRTNFTKVAELSAFLELSSEQRTILEKHPSFSLNLPYRLAEKIAKGTLDDPILKQFVPVVHEREEAFGFTDDPVEEKASRQSDKLLQKYEGRVLILATSACAMHCRYCFRQHFNYASGDKLFSKELAAIANETSINEVVLSGGDPLSLDDHVLEGVLKSLTKMAHIKRVRFHTRFPIGIPERIDGNFLALLEEQPYQLVFVVHVNHPHELDEDVFASLKAVQKLGIPVLNQSVLLKGVNDSADTLAELCSMLSDNGIMPYYLHQLDRAQGTAHFEVEEEKGKELIAEISRRLSGYAVPRYVKEEAGMPGKTFILP